MSQEVLEIVQGMDLEKIENQLALQCAPLFTGLKMSNLLIVHKDSVKEVIKMLHDTGISYIKLSTCKEKTTLLLYRYEELKQYLERQKVQFLLQEIGYPACEMEEILCIFKRRFCQYHNGCAEFPHEIGLLLGYPVEDVQGFIVNKGENFLYSGYWKVYGNPSAKKKLFQKYDKSIEMVLQLVACGVSILDILTLSRKSPASIVQSNKW